jgi:bacillithiol system protein YtxJ
MKTLTTQVQAEALLASPAVWIFKHSNTCPVSAEAEAQVATYLAAHPEHVAGMVVVQEARPVSNWLAGRLGYVHQSPQLFLVRDGKVAWQASHWGITAQAMAKAAG